MKNRKDMHFKRPTIERGWIILVTLLGYVFFSYAFSVIGFYCGIASNEYLFLISIIAAILTGIYVDNAKVIYDRLICIDIAIVIIAGSIFLSSTVYDQSYDGLRYHQEIIGALCDGWNPLMWRSGAHIPESQWSLHYAKAVEIAEASVVSFTGRMETGKAINIIMIASAVCGVYAFLRSMPTNIFLKNSNRVKRLSKIKSAVITMAIVGNPVVLSQWLVYYIDFYKYIYLILELLSFYLISRYDRNQRRMGYIILGMSLILAMGTKFNFFFEAGLSMVLAFIWLGIKKNYEVLRRLVIVSICALGIGSILAYHPYITNYLGNGHPLYPLMGDGAIDIMTGNTPEKYLHSDRVTNFFKSLFSVSIPNYDQRNGGFSVFMPILLFLSVIIAWKVRRYLNAVIWYIAGSIFLSCFIFEQTWWARYICQLWLWCGIFLIASQCVTYTKKLGCCMLVIMIIAGVLTICTSVSISVIRGSYLRYLFQACREAPVKVVGDLPIQIRRHLEEEEIKYIIIDSVPDNENINAVYYYYGCSPVIILSSDQIRHIDDNLKRLHQTVDRYRYVPMNLEEYGKTNEKEENSSF